MTDKRFRLHFEIDSTLDIPSLWPDGNAPENPTVKDVLALIDKEGGILSIIGEWNLGIDGDFSVEEVDGHGKQLAIVREQVS